MILDILKDGLEYAKTNSNQIIIFYLGVLIFPLILIEGYSYHIIENCLNGMINNRDKLTDMTINTKSFMNGLKLLILKVTYYLPEIILLLAVSHIPGVNYVLVMIVLAVLTIISYYVSEIASICMVESNLFKEGYNFSKIGKILKSVGLTYVELIVMTFIILLGIFAVMAIIMGFVTLLSTISTTLFVVISAFMILLYFVLMVIIIPLYVLFKNRTIVSVYNLK